MITKKISSLQHPFIKHLVKTRTDKKYRNEHKQVLIAGKKLVQELAPVSILITTEEEIILPDAKEIVHVPFSFFKKITGLENPEPFTALIPLPEQDLLENKHYILALDKISDPGNLGTLLRTALALGWEGVFLTDGSADPFNDKALRAAKGATFRIPLRMGKWEELDHLIAKNNMKVLVADIQGQDIHACTPISLPLLLVLGNESRGASPHAKQQFSRITIPMQGIAESLNVASAGAILMHSLKGLL